MSDEADELSSHFPFGANWLDFCKVVTTRHVDEAWRSLSPLLGERNLQGSKVLDIGSGSGLHAVAFAQQGAIVTAFDIDPDSVEATRALAEKFGVGTNVEVSTASILSPPDRLGEFDIVYAWGVLHHTGDMWRAIDQACRHVARIEGSLLILALYRKTRMDSFWRLEKLLYKSSPRQVQWLIRRTFALTYDLARLAVGKNPRQDDAAYIAQRGMSREHDYHDWLGGYPYESAMPDEVRSFVGARGFVLETERLVLADGDLGSGTFGSGCDEYVFARM